MWVGVTLAVLVELVEPEVKTTAVAAYFFIISNVGGNMPLLVPPIKNAFVQAGYGTADALRSTPLSFFFFFLHNRPITIDIHFCKFSDTLYLFYPGEYVIGAALFLVTLFVLRRDIDYIKQQQQRTSNDNVPRAAVGEYGTTSTIAVDEI